MRSPPPPSPPVGGIPSPEAHTPTPCAWCDPTPSPSPALDATSTRASSRSSPRAPPSTLLSGQRSGKSTSCVEVPTGGPSRRLGCTFAGELWAVGQTRWGWEGEGWGRGWRLIFLRHLLASCGCTVSCGVPSLVHAPLGSSVAPNAPSLLDPRPDRARMRPPPPNCSLSAQIYGSPHPLYRSSLAPAPPHLCAPQIVVTLPKPRFSRPSPRFVYALVALDEYARDPFASGAPTHSRAAFVDILASPISQLTADVAVLLQAASWSRQPPPSPPTTKHAHTRTHHAWSFPGAIPCTRSPAPFHPVT